MCIWLTAACEPTALSPVATDATPVRVYSSCGFWFSNVNSWVMECNVAASADVFWYTTLSSFVVACISFCRTMVVVFSPLANHFNVEDDRRQITHAPNVIFELIQLPIREFCNRKWCITLSHLLGVFSGSHERTVTKLWWHFRRKEGVSIFLYERMQIYFDPDLAA